MGAIELRTCDFCKCQKPVIRTYFSPKNYVRPENLAKANGLFNQGDYFMYVSTCEDCGPPVIKERLDAAPVYRIGIDTLDFLTYTLIREQDNNYEVLLLKTVENKERFDAEVNMISSLFNVEVIKETNENSKLKRYFKDTSFSFGKEKKKNTPDQKEIINKLIRSIYIVPSNFEYCSKNTVINGTLREEIERILIEFKNIILEK